MIPGALDQSVVDILEQPPGAENLLVGDVVVGVLVGALLFGLYYRFVLRPAREQAAAESSQDATGPESDTGD